MHLDAIDTKILAELYHNYREPISIIAKKCRISREQANYRINKFETTGLIKKYLTIFNYPALGYQEFIIIRLKVNQNSISEVKKKLSDLNNCISAFTCIGKYNLCANLICKDKTEFEEIFYTFLKRENGQIIDYNIFFTIQDEFYPLKFINKDITEKYYSVMEHTSLANLSEKELEILKCLEHNGRARLIDISKKTGISSDLLVYKLKKFRMDSIIRGVRIQLDLSKLGINFALYYLKLNENTKTIRNKISAYAKNHHHINALSFGISEYNCIIQIAYDNDAILKMTINDVEGFLSKNIHSSELLLIEEENVGKTLPL